MQHKLPDLDPLKTQSEFDQWWQLFNTKLEQAFRNASRGYTLDEGANGTSAGADKGAEPAFQNVSDSVFGTGLDEDTSKLRRLVNLRARLAELMRRTTNGEDTSATESQSLLKKICGCY